MNSVTSCSVSSLPRFKVFYLEGSLPPLLSVDEARRLLETDPSQKMGAVVLHRLRNPTSQTPNYLLAITQLIYAPNGQVMFPVQHLCYDPKRGSVWEVDPDGRKLLGAKEWPTLEALKLSYEAVALKESTIDEIESCHREIQSSSFFRRKWDVEVMGSLRQAEKGAFLIVPDSSKRHTYLLCAAIGNKTIDHAQISVTAGGRIQMRNPNGFVFFASYRDLEAKLASLGTFLSSSEEIQRQKLQSRCASLGLSVPTPSSRAPSDSLSYNIYPMIKAPKPRRLPFQQGMTELSNELETERLLRERNESSSS